MALIDQLKAQFPWMNEIGLTPEFFHDLTATSAGPAEIYQKVRQTVQYRQRFIGITRSDGTQRMNEADYLRTEATYKQLAAQYGMADQFKEKGSLVGLFESEIDPNEFKERLDVYKRVKDEGGALKDAFYVYAGMDLKDDDLFEAMVDPAAGAKLAADYNAAVATQPLDYETFISRSTQLGLTKISKTLNDLKTSGALTGQAVQTIMATDPNFAKQMMDVLYRGGDPNPGQPLSLQDLLATFEYASIGAAAKGAGLTIPTKERAKELRAAGVTRARAQEAYTQFGSRKGILEGAVGRIDDGPFGQDEFEKATLLGDSAQTERLNRALAKEEAAGKSSGGFQFGQDNLGRFQQGGLRSL